MSHHHSIAIYKPYDVVSQFTREADHHVTLADILPHVPKDVYPVGRLDRDSEGLLLLTNDRSANARLLSPRQHVEKEYYVQVEGAITDEAVDHLRKGVGIRAKKKEWITAPAAVHVLDRVDLPDRTPPIRSRKSIPTTWISITISEGKNRQIRRMCAAVGYPVLRLVRYRLGNITIGEMQPGQQIEIDISSIH